MRTRRAALLAGIALSAASLGWAQDKPAASVEDELKAARFHMKLEHWETAARAFRLVFEHHPDSEEVVKALAGIERDLTLCMYRAKAGNPSGKDLFGDSAESFNESTRKISLSFPYGPLKPFWEGFATMSGVLTIPLEGDVSVEFSARVLLEDQSAARYPNIRLCYDKEKGTGYELEPGYYRTISSGGGTTVFQTPTSIARWDGPSDRRSLAGKVMAMPCPDGDLACRVSRAGPSLTVASDGKTRATASDGKYNRGLVSVSADRITKLEIRGTVQEAYLKERVKEFHESQYRKWLQESWKRDDVIPGWARGK